MAQSLSNVIIHIIFSTKNREKTILENYKNKLHAYIATIIRDMGGNAFRIGGTEDHIHIACSLPRTITQSNFMQKIKGASSNWCNKNNLNNHWQGGFGIFSISASHLPNLLNYIDTQEEHHKKISFKDEFRLFLKKYHIDYDEKYVWD